MIFAEDQMIGMIVVTVTETVSDQIDLASGGRALARPTETALEIVIGTEKAEIVQFAGPSVRLVDADRRHQRQLEEGV